VKEEAADLLIVKEEAADLLILTKLLKYKLITQYPALFKIFSNMPFTK